MKRILFLVVTFGLVGHLTAQDNTWKEYLKGQAVKSIDFENDYVWAATDSFLVRLNKLDNSTTYYPYPEIIENMRGIIKIDNKGVKWIVRSDILLMNPVTSIYGFDENEWDKIEFDEKGLFFSLAVDKNNNKWITIGGFRTYLYKIEEDSCMLYTSNNSGLPYNYVFKIASDKEGNIWLANYGPIGEPVYAKIALMKNDGGVWNLHSSEEGFYTAIDFDSQGNPWVQYHNLYTPVDALRKLDTTSNSWSEQITLNRSYRLAAIEDDNKFWFTNYDNGIAVYDGSEWTFYTTLNSGLPSDTVYQIAIDSDGTKWIATDKGLARFVNESATDEGLDEFGGDDVTSVDNKSFAIDFKVYPNPVHDYITIKISGELQRSTVDILSIQGKVVKSFSLNNNQNHLDVRNLSSGVYLVRIQTGESYSIKKIVKQ